MFDQSTRLRPHWIGTHGLASIYFCLCFQLFLFSEEPNIVDRAGVHSFLFSTYQTV
jgi:hypothetical protein